MATWTIAPQTEKNGKVETEVLCKHVKHFPFNRAGKVTFGRFKFPVLRVIITDGTTEHKITWSNYHEQSLNSKSPGKFIYHWPSKMEHPKIKGRYSTTNVTGMWEDTLSPKIEVPGETMEFENHERFIEWMNGRSYIGPKLAGEIMDVFISRIIQLCSKAA